MKRKKGIIVLLSAIFMMSISGCAKNIPSSFPDINNEESGSSDPPVDITPVNFYFDNIENTKAIKYSGSVVTGGFMKSVIDTNRSTFATTDYHLELDNEKYAICESTHPLEDEYLSEEFYITDSNENTRNNPGILNLLFSEDEHNINMDEINVIFTDLSEKDIDKAARQIRDKYLSSEEYNVCLLAISMEIEKDYQPFYISTGNNKIIKVDENIENRFYYLIMLGPTAKVSAYIHCLKANLGDKSSGRLIEGGDYDITDYDYIQHQFNVEDDLNTDSISYYDANYAFSALYADSPDIPKSTEPTSDNENAEEETTTTTVVTTEPQYKDENEEAYKTHIIRLDSKSDYYKQDIWHLSYNKNSTDDIDLTPKGYQGNSLDFSLQANMDLASSLSNKRIHYITLDKKSDGSIVYIGLPDSKKISKEDVFFALGTEEDVQVYSVQDDSWIQLDSTRKSRFFKEFTTKSGRLSIISDNTDEGGISNIYITVPVYQIVVRKNYTPKWIDSRAYVIGQEHNGLDRYRKTYNLRQFYSMLFGVNIENKENDIYVDEVKMERNIIGYIRILITDI